MTEPLIKKELEGEPCLEVIGAGWGRTGTNSAKILACKRPNQSMAIVFVYCRISFERLDHTITSTNVDLDWALFLQQHGIKVSSVRFSKDLSLPLFPVLFV